MDWVFNIIFLAGVIALFGNHLYKLVDKRKRAAAGEDIPKYLFAWNWLLLANLLASCALLTLSLAGILPFMKAVSISVTLTCVCNVLYLILKKVLYGRLFDE